MDEIMTRLLKAGLRHCGASHDYKHDERIHQQTDDEDSRHQANDNPGSMKIIHVQAIQFFLVGECWRNMSIHGMPPRSSGWRL
jgi:hypothetical protein